MAAEHIRAAAVIGKRRQRREYFLLAEIGAEVALQPPEGGDHRRRHAELLIRAREHRAVLLDQLAASLDAIGRDHAVGEFDEGLVEDALAAVDVDDALVVDHLGRGRRKRPLRNAGAYRLAPELVEPAIEARAGAATR